MDHVKSAKFVLKKKINGLCLSAFQVTCCWFGRIFSISFPSFVAQHTNPQPQQW